MNYDKMTIKSLARDCSRDSFYKINAANLENRIQHLCDKYNEDKLNNLAQHIVSKRFWYFDTWDRNGKTETIIIEALNEKNATIILKALHEDVAFDKPY